MDPFVHYPSCINERSHLDTVDLYHTTTAVIKKTVLLRSQDLYSQCANIKDLSSTKFYCQCTVADEY